MRIVATAVILFVSVSAHAQLRLSFVGHSPTSAPRPVGSFDETVDGTLIIDLPGMREPGPTPRWFLSWSSLGHQKNGYPSLPVTDAWTACEQPMQTDLYDVILWLEPGEVMIGQQVPFQSGDDRVAFIYDDAWQSHDPWEFTHLRVVLVGQTGHSFQGPYCLKTYLIPIVWLEAPVSARTSTFGAIKALYRTKGKP